MSLIKQGKTLRSGEPDVPNMIWGVSSQKKDTNQCSLICVCSASWGSTSERKPQSFSDVLGVGWLSKSGTCPALWSRPSQSPFQLVVGGLASMGKQRVFFCHSVIPLMWWYPLNIGYQNVRSRCWWAGAWGGRGPGWPAQRQSSKVNDVKPKSRVPRTIGFGH